MSGRSHEAAAGPASAREVTLDALQAGFFNTLPLGEYDLCVQAFVGWLPADLATLTDVQCFRRLSNP